MSRSAPPPPERREKSARRDRTIETLEQISSTLCAAPGGPLAVCDAVVEAAAHLFDARWAAMVFSGDHPGVRMAQVFVHAGECVIQRWGLPPPMLAVLTERTLAAQGPVLAEHDEGLECGTLSGVLVTAPMSVHGDPAGILAVGLPNGIEVAPDDVSILVTLANHAGVALNNAWQSQENRTARELHDTVAQQLLTIGMNLEWCRRHPMTPPEVLEQVLAAQQLARSALDEIREVIFGRVGAPPGSSRDALTAPRPESG